ncbi:MAG: hypothetical protein COS85_04390, partial [Armatimonadetes bacterium CG07_land_8_20_14_0_80_59_28]
MIVDNQLATQDLITLNWKPGVFGFHFSLGDADNNTAGNTYLGGAVPGISYGGAGSATALDGVPPAFLVLAGIDPNAVAALSKVGLASVGVPANDEMVSARIDFP